LDWKSMVKAAECLMDKTEEKQKQQEENSRILLGELKRSEEVRGVFKAEMDRMRELFLSQEIDLKNACSMQHHRDREPQETQREDYKGIR